MLQMLLKTTVSLVFPMDCPGCGQTLGLGSTFDICEPCQASIRPLSAPFCPGCGRTLLSEVARCADCSTETFDFDRAFAAERYEGKLRELMHHFKFNGQTHLKTFFTSRMAAFYRSHLKDFDWDAVLAVPMFAEQKRQRGFDQAELLARGLSDSSGLKLLTGRLMRTAQRPAQHLLSKDQRRSNLKGSFRVRDGHRFDEMSVLLIDDILTTGYTASECARVLKDAGAASVTVFAAARGDRL